MGFVKQNIDGMIQNYSQADINLRAQEVLKGKWGNGPERIQRLIDAGYDPKEVQAVVNQMMNGNYPVTETMELIADQPTPTTSGNPNNNQVPTPTDNNQVQAPINNNEERTVFKHEESNKLADMARKMGYTEDQVKLAIGISRWETGNYQHLAGGYNYGGVTGVGDAGSYEQYANYSSEEVGMKAYLENLKKNYIDQNLTTPEACARKYLGYDDNGSWIKGVYGCMK